MSKEEVFANPATLGLWGFGLTTVVLSLHNAGIIPSTGMTLAYAFFWGGMAQVFAGWISFRRGDMFAATAFSTYGLFWIGFGLAFVFHTWNSSVFSFSGREIGAWMALWGVLTLFYTVGAYMLRAKALTVVLGLLVATFWLLAVGLGYGIADVTIAGGWVGLVCGLSAIYTGLEDLMKWVSNQAKQMRQG